MPNIWRLADLGLQDHDIRAAFIPAEGRKFIICDYSGIELVILAAMSGDENLTDQILHGDIHSYVGNALMAEEMTRVLGEAITPKNKKGGTHKILRDEFKRVSYGTVYGSTGWNIYRTCYPVFARVGIPITQTICDAWINRWKFELFPKTGALLEANGKLAVTQLYTKSILGRRRRWDDSIRQEKWKFFKAQREGMNQPIQSSSADMTKLAMILLAPRLDRRYERIVACVHDELIAEATLDRVERVKALTKEAMEEAGYMLFPDLPKGMIVADPKDSDRYDK